MSRRARDLMAQIESDVLDDSRSLTAALNTCVVLGGRAGSVELREWALQELRGYPPDSDSLPDYRLIPAPLTIDGISGNHQVKGEQISVLDLPEFAREHVKDHMDVIQGVGEIEGMIRQAESDGGFIHVGLRGSPELARLWSSELGPHRSVERVYRVVAAANLRAVTDGIRTTLAELVGELRAGMSDETELPSAELAGQAFQVAVHGSRNRVTLTNAQASSGAYAQISPPADRESHGWWTGSRRVGAAVVGLATIAGAVAAVLALHPKF